MDHSSFILSKITLDGYTLLPFVFLSFCSITFVFGFRTIAQRLFPINKNIDAAFTYIISVDLFSWIFCRHLVPDDLAARAFVGTFFSPAGHWYPLVVFAPVQIIFIVTLTALGEVPFHVTVYTAVLLLTSCAAQTVFNLSLSVNTYFHINQSDLKDSRLASVMNGVLLEHRTQCDDQAPTSLFLLFISLLIIIITAFRNSASDRMNGLLLIYAFQGMIVWANCAKNIPDSGLSIWFSLIGSFLLVRVERIWFTPGEAFKKLDRKAVNARTKIPRTSSVRAENIRRRNSRYSNDGYFVRPHKVIPSDIKKVAIVLDGFVGPKGVVCGISRSYETWIFELVNQGVQVIIYSAFDSDEIEDHFNSKLRFSGSQDASTDSFEDLGNDVSSNSSSDTRESVFNKVLSPDLKVAAYRLDALDMKYVQQTYFATRCNWRNIKIVSKSFFEEDIDVVHVVFDGSSAPLFSFACALLRIPIVGIMHTDTIVICERNGFSLLAPLVLFCQKAAGAALDSIATRSKSFAREMMRLRKWKCDHVVKPHVKTDVFFPFKNEEVFEMRKQMTFSESLPEYIESKAKFSDGKLLLLYAGRFDIDKRVDELLMIMEQLNTHLDMNIYLALIGDGSLSQDLEKMHGKENRVFCVPGFKSHEELAVIYNAADIHISASQMETLGNTVLESMACGTPVVVPRAQGFVDTVTNERNGLLWAPEDLQDAVEKVRELNLDSERLYHLKKGARDSIGDLHVRSAVKDILKWYAKASESRLNRTNLISRLVYSVGILIGMFFFDLIIFKLGKRGLERFSQEEARKRNRQELIQQKKTK